MVRGWEIQEYRLRSTVTDLIQSVMVVTADFRATPTTQYLYWSVHALSQAMTVTDDPKPLLSAVDQVLNDAEKFARRSGRLSAGDSQERHVWKLLDELRVVYRRDRHEILDTATERVQWCDGTAFGGRSRPADTPS